MGYRVNSICSSGSGGVSLSGADSVSAAAPRVAMFLAQIAHESRELTRLEENLNYSAERLRTVFPRRFSPELAEIYAHQPSLIANRAYANRMGNGDQVSGDGWCYQGRGPIQLTGKDNYRRASEDLGMDLEAYPEQIADLPEVGALVAAWYFAEWKNCLRLADRKNLVVCSIAINGAVEGLDSRRNYYRTARRIFGVA